MHLFYYPSIDKELFTLDSIESAHCIKVLRLDTDDIIHLTDGKGKLCRARIVDPDRKACVAKITEITHIPRERSVTLQIAIAPTKKIERFEWFLEKSTEIGIDSVIPMMCRNSERRIIKEERLKKIMVSAMKQSLKAWLPEFTPLMSFEKVVGRHFTGNRFIATRDAPPGDHLGEVFNKESDTLILIGPEGDFQSGEMDMAIRLGFMPVSLGNARLRTETAGLVACHTINLMHSLK